MKRVFDCFPFFDELDLLEIRLNELDSVVNVFVICEAGETYSGQPKPYFFEENKRRFEKFRHKIIHVRLPKLYPACKDRVSGREREAYARNEIISGLQHAEAQNDDFVMLSDCDEIPSAESVRRAIDEGKASWAIHRFKQKSFYYNVNRLTDYGHDWASRARIGTFWHVKSVGGLYNFRMAYKNTEEFVIENGGWHFGYFGDLEKIKRKVAALSPFLSEYKLFGDNVLVQDILEGRDLHHRRCELPERFQHTLSSDPTLPAYFLANRDTKFKHLTLEGQLEGRV